MLKSSAPKMSKNIKQDTKCRKILNKKTKTKNHNKKQNKKLKSSKKS